MFRRLRLRLNSRIIAWVGVAGVGMLPCPDRGIPLAVHVWPVAAVVWLWRRLRRRSEAELDLVLSDELRAKAHDHRLHKHPHSDPPADAAPQVSAPPPTPE